MKTRLKRILALVLSSTVVFQCAAFSAVKDDEVYFYEDFNQYALNETETSLEVSNTVANCVNLGDDNKALKVATGISKGMVTAKWEAGVLDNTVVAFDFMQKVESSDVTVSILDSKGNESTVLQIKKDGTIRTYDNKIIGGFSLDAEKEIAVCIDSVREEYSVAIDSRTCISDWYMQKSDIIPTGVKFTFGSGDTLSAEVYIDNICVFGGENMRKNFTPEKNNEEVIDIIDVPATLGASILTKNDMEDLADGETSGPINEVTINKKSNSAYIKTESGNKFLVLDKNSTDDMHLDMNFTNDVNYLVVQADFRFDKFGPSINPSILRDTVTNAGNVDMDAGTINSAGTFTLRNGNAVCTFNKGQWYNIAIVYKMPARSYDVYIDYELVAKDTAFPVSNFVTPRMCRIWMSGSAQGVMAVDNYRVYEAMEPVESLDEIESKQVSIMSDGTREKALLEGRSAICTANGMIYAGGVKELAEKPEEKYGDIYVNNDMAVKLLGELPAEYELKDEVPLKAAAAQLGLKVYENSDLYLVIFSENEFKADDALLSEVSTFMKNLLPAAEDIRAAFDEKASAGVHPRIIATAEDFERIRNEIVTDERMAQWHKKIIAKADTLLDREVDKYVLGSESGGQANILTVVRNWCDKMIYWGYAWQVTKDSKYLDAAWEELLSCCSFKDWNPSHTIDTGEALLAVAIGYDWFYEALTEEQRSFIEQSAYELGLVPINSAYYGKLHVDATFSNLSGGNFVKQPTNFNPVVNGGMINAALAFADVYPDLCFDSVSKAIQSLGYALPKFEPDGAWEEGPNYWDYATIYFAYLISALETSCGSDFGIMSHPGFSSTPYYAMYLDSFQGINNFSDTAYNAGSLKATQFACFGKYMNDKALTYYRYSSIDQPTVFDMIWYDSSVMDEKPELKLDYWSRGLDMVSIREDWERSDSLNFGAHGGKNNVYHAHYDGGSWIFDLLGERWAVDLGMDNSTYLGYNMYTVYRGRAEGHNMLVFNPKADEEDFILASYTNLERFESAPKGAIAVYDNTEGYSKWCSYVKRGFFVSDERRSLTVRDEFKPLVDNTEVYWNMQTPAQIEIQGNKAILTINNKKLVVEFLTNAEDFELIATTATPISGLNSSWMASDADKNKLMLKATVSGDCYIEAKLYAMDEPAAESGMINKPISEWKVPEGELIKRSDSNVSAIYVDGEPLEGFDENTTTYTLGILEGEKIPIVTAESENGRVEISQAETTDEVTTVTGYDANGYYKTTYVIKYSLLKKPEDVFGMTRNIVYKLSVSSTPEEQNFGANMLDGDLQTRWAAEGDGEYAIFDLGEVKRVDAIAIAFEWGDERNYRFDVEVSSDGEYYKQVFSGKSCGTTEDLELIEIEPQKARYVRFTGHGNTVNAWSGVREFGILTKK